MAAIFREATVDQFRPIGAQRWCLQPDAKMMNR
jgi:hypothetical protein